MTAVCGLENVTVACDSGGETCVQEMVSAPEGRPSSVTEPLIVMVCAGSVTVRVRPRADTTGGSFASACTSMRRSSLAVNSRR